MRRLGKSSEFARKIIYDARHRRIIEQKRDYLHTMLMIADFYRILPYTKDSEEARSIVSKVSRAQFFRYKKIFDERILGEDEARGCRANEDSDRML